MKEHDRLSLAKKVMERKLEGRRTSSKLPELVELVMAKPLLSAGMVAKTVEVTPQAARRIVLELGLREMTGRGWFRHGGFCDLWPLSLRLICSGNLTAFSLTYERKTVDLPIGNLRHPRRRVNVSGSVDSQ